MFSRRIIARLFVCCSFLVALPDSSTFAQAPLVTPRTQQATETRPSMRVIEVTPHVSGTNHFTIVGAVHRSGVFTSQKRKIQLGDLIQAAGGLTAEARSTIRVIRNGRNGYRMYYDPAKPSRQIIQADDVIVVLPKAGVQTIQPNDPLVPVACIGLYRRPVVIPLIPEIRTVDDLIARLDQKFHRSTVRLIDPFGRSGTVVLAPGTVLFFDPTVVDRSKFTSPKSFPPTAPLMKRLPEDIQGQVEVNSPRITPGIAPATLSPEQFAPGAIQAPAGRNVSQPLLPAFSGQASVGIENPPIPEPSRVSSQDLLIASPIGLAVTPSSSEVKKRRSQGMAFTPQPEVDLPLLDDQSTASANDLYARHQLPIIAPAPPETAVTGHADVGMTELSSSALRAASRQPLSSSSEIDRGKVAVPHFSDITQQVSIGTDAKDESENKTSSILPIALGVALLGAFCLIGSILWSRHDRHRLQQQFHVAASVANEEKSVELNSDQSQVAFVLDRSVPMIEEEVVLPTETAIHGEPVGQRRIIVHERHTTINGPHFGNKSRKEQVARTSAVSSTKETPLAKESTTIVDQRSAHTDDQTQQTKGQQIQNSIVQPVPEASNDSYDVVEPDSKVASGSIQGALERALTMLAAEKKQ